jgi:hypothetical protein
LRLYRVTGRVWSNGNAGYLTNRVRWFTAKAEAQTFIRESRWADEGDFPPELEAVTVPTTRKELAAWLSARESPA